MREMVAADMVVPAATVATAEVPRDGGGGHVRKVGEAPQDQGLLIFSVGLP